MQDAKGFVLHNAKVHTSKPTASIDGCHSVMLLNVDFDGKQLNKQTKNGSIFVSGE